MVVEGEKKDGLDLMTPRKNNITMNGFGDPFTRPNGESEDMPRDLKASLHRTV